MSHKLSAHSGDRRCKLGEFRLGGSANPSMIPNTCLIDLSSLTSAVYDDDVPDKDDIRELSS